jgi:hypothetical protein
MERGPSPLARGLPMPGGSVPAAQVREGTSSVIAEVEAISRSVLARSRRESGADTFLGVRVTRLALAADYAVSAARRGDFPVLRAELRHFETLTSAIWAVEDALYGSEPESVPEPAGL